MLTNRELAMVIMALRHWQRTTTNAQRTEERAVASDIDKRPHLSDSEIDSLCTRLNATEPTQTVPRQESGALDECYTSPGARAAYVNVGEDEAGGQKTVMCVVACHNAQGEPDLAFVKVRCTQSQYDEGDHYIAAEQWARDDNYEPPFVVFDEADAPAALLTMFVWESASVVPVKNG